MSDEPRWRPLYRVIEPRDPDAGCSGTPLAEVRTFDIAPNDGDEATCRVLAIAGDLCAYSTAILAPVLAELSADAVDLELDLSLVTFADASAITLLFGLRRQVDERGGALVLDPLSPCVVRLFSLAGLADVLARSRSPEPALTAPTVADRR